jgi:asparagine N-glycosylation enzyme membrane subunit Stt3
LLREAPQIAIKSKRRIARVSKEYSGIAIFLVFMLLVTNLAYSPQNGGMPRVYGQAYSPITISAASLPLGGSLPSQAEEWFNMLSWTQNNLQSTTIVCSWWDYGYWLSVLGNVTTLADNATINTTQIENIGYIFMAPEDKALQMLKLYDAEYILVFITLQIGQSTTDQSSYVVQFSRFGDEAKWSWMARISGEARQRYINEGFMDANLQWTDENAFGAASNQTGTWEWNTMGKNSTVYKLMSYAKQRWADESGEPAGVLADEPGVQPSYFKEAYFSGEELNPVDASTKYSGLIPIVALYEIDWEKYYDTTAQP